MVETATKMEMPKMLAEELLFKRGLREAACPVATEEVCRQSQRKRYPATRWTCRLDPAEMPETQAKKGFHGSARNKKECDVMQNERIGEVTVIRAVGLEIE